MDHFHESLASRVAQFERYLKIMEQRRSEVGKDCFIIFTDSGRSEDANSKELQRQQSRSRERVATPSGLANDFANAGIFSAEHDTEESADSSENQNRFVQFAFVDRFFYLDLPNTTLPADEAERLMRDRAGFCFLRQRPNFPYDQKYCDTFDPIQKPYLNGEQADAAADAAFIFFRLWNCPPDMAIYVKASAFGDQGPSWENYVPMV